MIKTLVRSVRGLALSVSVSVCSFDGSQMLSERLREDGGSATLYCCEHSLLGEMTPNARVEAQLEVRGRKVNVAQHSPTHRQTSRRS